MAITTSVYNTYKSDLFSGNIDHVNDVIKVALVTSSYSVDVDAHEFFDDITNEITGTGYTAGGVALTSKTVTTDDTDNEGVFDAADASWPTATFTTRGAVVYKVGASDATSPLMFYINFGQDESPSAANFNVVWSSDGVANIN